MGADMRWTTLTVLLSVLSPAVIKAAPRVLLHHGFDQSVDQPDYQRVPLSISAGTGVELRQPGISGQAAWFGANTGQATLRIDLNAAAPTGAWTIALWEILEVKDWLTAPEDNLLTLLDADNRPIIKLSKSGDVFVYADDRVTQLDCFDALYWVQGNREHLTLTWDPTGSGVQQPQGLLRAYWKARPYAAFVMDLERRPVALEIGQPSAGLGVDDLYVFAGALSLRSISDVMHHRGSDIAALERQLSRRETSEARRPSALRDTAWANLARKGLLVEAEAQPAGSVTSSPTPVTDKPGRFDGSDNNASSASGRSCVVPGREPLMFPFRVTEAGPYALAVRYCLERRMQPLWPQGSSARTAWTENDSEITVLLDGKPLKTTTRLYPTGVYKGHRGDVEMWAWQTLNSGHKVDLDKGPHTLQLKFQRGLAKPIYDALLVSDRGGPAAAHRRWIDRYRMPPAWWVAGHTRQISEGLRRDTYTVSLRNRCDEPCSYEVVVGSERLQRQRARADTNRIELAPFEEKTFRVTFESPADLHGNSEWANIYLWNEDVALRQKYRLWNLLPDADAQSAEHPVLLDKPDRQRQAKLRHWLKQRDPQALTPELQRWIQGRNLAIGQGGTQIRAFPAAFSGDRLAALDSWMRLTDQEIEQYLPDGPAEFQGYGTGWERTGVEYAGVWHKMPRVERIAPAGDIDLVTSLTVGGPPQQGKQRPYSRTYTAENDVNLISCVRDTRWQSMLGTRFYGAAPYANTVLGRAHHTGIPLLAEAYYLTGDRAYARKALQMILIFARKYTSLTKHFHFALHREDRDWWGGRIGGRYLSKFGPRHYQAMGVYVLDLIWDALSPAERSLVEHNVLRWGMYEGMSGPLFEHPEYFAAVNREDLPYLVLGRVLGDPAPRQGLEFYYSLYKGTVLEDGIHQCSIGSYGGVNGYVSFLQKLSSLGVDVSDDRALRNLFSAHPSFIFSGGGFPNIDDGGGVNLHGLGAGFGCPSRDQYAWGKQLFADASFDTWPDVIAGAGRVANAAPENKSQRMRQEYLDGKFPIDTFWPHVYIAPIKGMAMLRNRIPKNPLDWNEVIFDYGRYGGRSHGHPAKLATIPSLNGQIVSMEYGYGLHGKPVSPGFHMRSYAHNVVVADGRDQFHASAAVPVGSLRESHSDPNVQWVDAESQRIYTGIAMRRTVFTTDFGIVDLHLCRSEGPHQYDWMYHSFGVADSPAVTLAAVDQLADSGPLTFAANPRTAATSDLVQVVWKNSRLTKPATKSSTALLDEDSRIRVWCLPVANTTVAIFGIPMVESVGSEIDYLMLRRQAASTVFATVQEAWRGSRPSVIRSVSRKNVTDGKRMVADHEACALEVLRVDGSRSVFLVNYTANAKTVGRVMTDAPVATWNISQDGKILDPAHSPDRSFSVR